MQAYFQYQGRNRQPMAEEGSRIRYIEEQPGRNKPPLTALQPADGLILQQAPRQHSDQLASKIGLG